MPGNFSLTADNLAGALASSSPTFFGNPASVAYSDVRSVLFAAASTPASLSATSLLPIAEPTGATGNGYFMRTAEAQAPGFLAPDATLDDGHHHMPLPLGS